MKKIKISNIILIFFFLGIAFFYFYQLGKIPQGFFCDEAQTSLQAYKVLRGDFSSCVNLFFCQHFSILGGSLGIYTTAPFVALFGLTEYSTRMPSAVFALLSFLVLYLILKKMKTGYSQVVILLLALTPIFYHISRINFGLLCSFFFVLLGVLFYFYSCKRNKIIYALLSGLFFGVSIYGYPGFLLSIPLFLIILFFSELVSNGFNIKKYQKSVVALTVFLICYLPVIITIRNHPEFFNRLREKNDGNLNLFSKQKLINIITNYPKYYSYDYLFKKGETSVTRHSVPGNGIFLQISFFLIIAAYLIFIGKIILRQKDNLRRPILPFFLLFLFFPFPDILTTKNTSPPYSLTAFTNIFFLPFIVSYFFSFIKKTKLLNGKAKKIIMIFIALVIIVQGFNFYGNYQRYPLYSADFWGWQYGPKEIIAYFLAQKNNYNELYMTGYFNTPDIF